MARKTVQHADPAPREPESHLGRVDISTIVTRIVGIYAFVHSLDYIQVIIWTMVQTPAQAPFPWYPLLFSTLIFIILLGVGVYFFFWPNRFAGFLVHESFPDEHVLKASAHEIQLAAFAVVGLIVAIRGFTSLARMLAFLLSRPEPRAGLPANTVGDLTVAVVGLLLGLYLLIDSRGVVNLIRRLRGT